MSESYKKLPRIDVDVPMPKTTPPPDSSLPAWESVKECRKCGTLRRSYDHAPDMLDLVMSEFKYEHIGKGEDREWLDGVEHMLVSCPRCFYTWDEQTKDAADD